MPVFAVKNPNKPNKVRMVMDAAAVVDGVSFNSLMYTSPNLLVSLMSVLFRFRERRVAICGDIKEMYHQFRIREYNQQFQRFLWSNINPNNPPDVYIMQAMTFVSCCSPSSAQFIKNKNAIEFSDQYPRAERAILDNHYVDDRLDSLADEAEAIEVAK